MAKLNTNLPLPMDRMGEEFDAGQQRFKASLDVGNKRDLTHDQQMIQFLTYDTSRLQACIVALDEKIEALLQVRSN